MKSKRKKSALKGIQKLVRVLSVIAIILTVILALMVGFLIASEVSQKDNQEMNPGNTGNKMTLLPWEKPSAKKPADYTWEEFRNLSGEEQIAFQKAFFSDDEFEAWMEREQPTDSAETMLRREYPWEKPGAKQPVDYTWEEFLNLSGEEQLAFQNTFASNAEFEAWMECVNPTESEESTQPTEYPWEKPGAKKPKDYTWEEFQNLTGEEQLAFQKTFDSDSAFEAWMEHVLPTESVENTQPKQYPWEKPGAKKPEEYSWEEFQELTGEEQIAFQKYFSSEAEFEAWMKRAQSTNSKESAKYPWDEPGAKQPEDYTWEEFEALTAEQQMAFQNYLGPEAFEAWLIRVTS